MDQEKLAELIRMVLSDRRIQELIRSSLELDGAACQAGKVRRELVLLEARSDFENLLPEAKADLDGMLPAWKTYVCCQDLPEGGGAFISLDQAVKEEWEKIRIYRPSLNLIAKLAAGIADEPVLKLIQEKLVEGSKDVELVCFDQIQRIKAEAYRKLFLGHIERIKSFGIKVVESCGSDTDGGFAGTGLGKTASAQSGELKQGPAWINWQYKALTERDLLDVEKGAALKIGRKCIVTSLAADMARRKSIRICREGVDE
jgi:hypothetical protein